MKEPPHPVLAQGKVRHVGDQVALVVAETLQQAQGRGRAGRGRLRGAAGGDRRSSAADAVGAAVHDDGAGQPLLRLGPSATRRRSTRRSRRRRTSPSSTFVNNRLIPNAIEPRAANASYNRARRELHALRRQPEPARRAAADERLRARPAGAQGARDRARRRRRLRLEDLPVRRRRRAGLGRASSVGRPIKWTAERSESFLTDAHGRDHVTTAELAMDDGRQLPRACACKTIANMGAYLSTFASCVPTILYATLLAGQYKTPAIYAEVKAVFTNTAPVDAYRGAGRPEATYVVERLVEHGGARDEDGPGRDPAAQLHHRPSRTRRRSALHLRHRRLRGARSTRRMQTGRRRRLRGAQGGLAKRRARSAASATRATSRPAASRRRTSPARSARAPACSRRARCACIRPAR